MKEKLMKMREEKDGFTLAELLIVVAIIAVLVAIAIPVFTTSLHASQDATEMANARSLYADRQADYLAKYNQNGSYTPDTDSLKLSDGEDLSDSFKNGTCTVTFDKDKGYTVTWTADSGCPSGNTTKTWGAQ